MVALLTRLLEKMMNMEENQEELCFSFLILCPKITTIMNNMKKKWCPLFLAQKSQSNHRVGEPKGESMGLSFFWFSQTALSPVTRAKRTHAATALSATWSMLLLPKIPSKRIIPRALQVSLNPSLRESINKTYNLKVN